MLEAINLLTIDELKHPDLEKLYLKHMRGETVLA